MSKSATMSQVFDLEDGNTVMFQSTEFDGMVGESIIETVAFMVNPSKGHITKMNLEELKAIYKTLTWKTERIKFWFAMRPLTPKGVAEELERQGAEIEQITR